MTKRDLMKEEMKGGLDGLISSTNPKTEKRTVKTADKPKEKERSVHCNFVIDKSIHTRMKILAIEKDMSLRDIVNEAMKEYLERNEKNRRHR